MDDHSDALAEQTEALQVEVAGLRVQLERLNQRADGLRTDLTSVGDRTTKAEHRIVRTAVALIVLVALAALIGLTAWRQAATDKRLDGLCPVLALVVGGADPSTRPAGPARDAYVASIAVMHKAYDDLGCTDPLVPPRKAGT